MITFSPCHPRLFQILLILLRLDYIKQLHDLPFSFNVSFLEEEASFQTQGEFINACTLVFLLHSPRLAEKGLAYLQ